MPISGGSATPAPPPLDGANLPIRLSKRQRWWIAAAVALVLIALGTWAAQRFRQAPADERVFSLQINPPEGSEFTFGTQAAGISLSPDGKTAAYVATHQGKAALWVRPLDSTTARLLAGTEDAGMPFWSPDSKSIAFFAHGKLQRVYLAGGTPQTICDDRLSPRRLLGQQRSNSVWRLEFRPVPGRRFRRTTSPLTTLDASRGEVFHYWPQILPGGRVLVLCPEQQA